MLRSIASHLSYANVMATAAVFIALGGVGYAAIKLPANSVGGAQIVNGSITGADVKNGSLTGSDVKDKSLSGADTCTAADKIKDRCPTNTSCNSKSAKDCEPQDTVKTVEPGPIGPPGAPGTPGTAGPKGDQGSPGPSSSAFMGTRDGDVPLTNSTSPGDLVGRLILPAGTFVVTASTTLENQDTVTATSASCTLTVGSASTVVVAKLSPSPTGGFRDITALTVAGTLATTGSATLECATGAGVTSKARDTRIVAVKVDPLTSGPLTTS